ncbi:bifunctional ornithine acetyltransferase/N-acetylglutamate synthase, partial [Streptococcus pyogenes]
IPVMITSTPVPFNEEEMSALMQADQISITVDLHSGDKVGQAWGCDLSYDYVKINALYRT